MTTNSKPQTPPAFIRVSEAAKRISDPPPNLSTLWRWEKDGRMPSRKRIGPGMAGYLTAEFETFLADPAGWRTKHSDKAA